jgi:hypothetical protein
MTADYTVQHLLAEMSRIQLLCQRRIAQLQKQHTSGMGGLVVTEDELAAFFSGGDSAPLPESVEGEFQRQSSQIALQIYSSLAEAEDVGESSRFASLCETFELSPFERDILLICLAPILDRRYERLLAYLHDDVTLRRPTVSLILSLLIDSPIEQLQQMPSFLDRGPLLRYRLLHHVEEVGTQPSLPNRQLAVDETVVAWLLGHYHPDPRLGDHITLDAAVIGPEEELLTREIHSTISAAINGQTLAIFHGDDIAIQQATARLLANNANLRLLTADLPGLLSRNLAAKESFVPEVLRLLLRDAGMTGSALFLQGWDAITNGQHSPSAGLIKALFEARTPVIISSEKEWFAHGVERSGSILRVKFSKPSYRQRRTLWDYFTDAAGYSMAPDLDLQSLASQFSLESRQIQDAVASARDAAIQRGDLIHRQDLVTAARVHSSPNLAGLARKIEPRYEWDDIVLPDDQRVMLRELIQTVQGRGLVMEEWGVGRKLKTSSGVTVLFAGPPGTGKTMSAEVIAGELGLDLYKIDLSMVVSKFIGETEKNLGKIFDEAQSSSAILFFDEADAIFGKRSEVKDSHDRYANMEVSYLLQRMEQYDGVTILATNLRANMDEAFTRRMQFIVDFPFPDAEERLFIWQTLFPADLPKADDINLSLFATRFKLAGGNIRNIIAGAAFLAAANGGVVTMEHLLHGTRRELQKMGRLISDLDLSF